MTPTHRSAALFALATGMLTCMVGCQPADTTPTPEPPRGAGDGKNRDSAAAKAKKKPAPPATKKEGAPDDGWSSNGSDPKPAAGGSESPVCGSKGVKLAGGCVEAMPATAWLHPASGDRRYVVAPSASAPGEETGGLVSAGAAFHAVVPPAGAPTAFFGLVKLHFMVSADGLEHRVVSMESERAELAARDWKVEGEALAFDRAFPGTVPLRAFRQDGSGRVVHSARAGAECAGAKDLERCGREDLTGLVDAGVSVYVFP